MACALTSNAFVVNSSTVSSARSKSLSFKPTYALSLRLEAKKQPADEVERKGVDYGDIAKQFVNPLNPYSWFLYFFVGIYVFDAIKN